MVKTISFNYFTMLGIYVSADFQPQKNNLQTKKLLMTYLELNVHYKQVPGTCEQTQETIQLKVHTKNKFI